MVGTFCRSIVKSCCIITPCFLTQSSPDKCFDHLTYAPGLIAQAVATGCRRYDYRFGIVQWVSAMLRFNQHLLSLHQVEDVKALFACITLEMIAERGAMDS